MEKKEMPSFRKNGEGFLEERFGLSLRSERSTSQGAHGAERTKAKKNEGTEEFGIKSRQG